MNQPEHWYVLNLGDALLAGDELERMKELFQASDAGAPDAASMAIFSRHESEGQLHCDLKLYFSPAAAALARSVGASICRKPSPGDLGLFAGSNQAWTRLFNISR